MPPIKTNDDLTAQNIAYLMLYRTYEDREPCWPAHHFEAEADIAPLLARGHTEAYGPGYRITPDGIAYWEAHRAEWMATSGINPRMRSDSHASRLLAFLADGEWHAGSEIPSDISAGARYVLNHARFIETEQIDNRLWRYRILPKGYERLVHLGLIERESEAS